MSFIQKLFTSRANNADGATYIGQDGRIWWDPVTNAFYYSDGITPGGIPITASGGGGSSGYSGYSGFAGTSIVLKGAVPTSSDLPTNSSAGDLWVTLDTEHGWVSDGMNNWSDVGHIQGPQGFSGSTGAKGDTGLQGISGFSGAGGGSPPAGSNTQVQFNNSGYFGASSAFTFDSTTNVLSINGVVNANTADFNNDAVMDIGVLQLDGNISTSPLNVGLLQIGVPLTFTDSNILTSATANVDSYAQFVLQNQSSGQNAATDFIVNNDQGSASNYGDFGINSSNFVGVGGAFSTPGGTYLYSSNNSLAIGTLASDDVVIATNAIPRLVITAAGHTSVGPLANLTITGGIDGQIIQTDGQGNLTWATNITDPVGKAATLYLDPNKSIADSKFLSTTPSVNPETTNSCSPNINVYSGFGYLKRFISGSIGTTTLAGGIWTFTNYVKVSDNTGFNKVVTRINRRVVFEGLLGTFSGGGPDRTFTCTNGNPFTPQDAGDGTVLTASLIETPTQTSWIMGYTSSNVVTVHLSDPAFVSIEDTPITAMYYWLFDTSAQAPQFSTSDAIETQVISLYQPEITGLNPADRLVAAYFGWTDSSTPHTFTLYYAGQTNYSRIGTPFTTSSQFQWDIHRSGFLNQTETSFGFDPVTYIFTLGDNGTGWTYYRDGLRLTMYGNRQVKLPGTPPSEGLWFIYIDDNLGNLTASLVPWTLLDSKIPVVAIPFCEDSIPTYFLEEERHSVLIDRRVHYYLHKTRGTQYVSGGNLSGYQVQVDTDGAHTFAMSETVIVDEDIIITCAGYPDPDGTAEAYLTFFPDGPGLSWDWVADNQPFPYNTAPGGYIQWNNNYVLTEGSGTNYYTSYILATNIVQSVGRFVVIPGCGEFATIEAARAEDPRNFALAGLPIDEWTYLWKFIWQGGHTSKGSVWLAEEPISMRGSEKHPPIMIESGSQGIQGSSGYSGFSGSIGLSGYSGSGISGYSGEIGLSGYSGSGISGYSGETGLSVASTAYKFLTNITDSDPGAGYLKVNDVDPTNATKVWIDYFNSDGTDLTNYLGLVKASDKLYLQVPTDSSKFFLYSVINSTDKSGYYEFSVLYISSGNATSLSNQQKVLLSYAFAGASGISGWSGISGTSGFSGLTGVGTSGWSGTSGISGTSGWSGISGQDGVIGVDGKSGWSGISGWSGSGVSGFSGTGTSGWSGFSGAVTNGTFVPLGTPTDGSWADGINTWTSVTTVTDALDDINELLSYLAPVDALSLSGSLTMASTTLYTGFVSANNVNYKTGLPAGSSYTTLITDPTFTLATPAVTTTFNKADEGYTRWYSAVGTAAYSTYNNSVDHAANFVIGSRAGTQGTTPWTNGQLSVTSVAWYNSFPKWQKGNATLTITATQLSQGYNRFKITREGTFTTQTSNDYEVFYDNDAGASPVVSGIPTVVEGTTVNTRQLSGVKYYDRGTTFKVGTIGLNCFSNVYTLNPITLTSSNTNAMGNASVPWNDATVTGVSAVPVIGETMTVTDKVITVPASNIRSIDCRVSVTPADPYGTYVAVQTASAGRLVDGYLNSAAGTSSDIGEFFDDEWYRMLSSFNMTSVSYSAGATGGWDSTISLVSGTTGYAGLQCFNGGLKYPVTNYTTGFLPSTGQVNYAGAAGNRTYLRYFYVGAGMQTLTFTIANQSGTTTFVSVATGASGNNLTFEMLAPNTTVNGSSTVEFKDCFVAYTADTSIGCYASGTKISTTSNWACSLGTKSTSASGNAIIIRITASSAWTGVLETISVIAS